MQVFRLPTMGVLKVSGAERHAFLQGQMTQDATALKPDGVALGAFLTPAGRVLAIARLIERDDAVLLVLPTELIEGVRERLQRYVLRAKVRLALQGDALAVAAVIADSAAEVKVGFAAGAEEAHLVLADGVSLVNLGRRALLIGSGGALASRLDHGDGVGPAAWEAAAVADGEPAVVAATAEVWTAQMLNLDLLGAISFTKGCYTGQEIVARTQHLGRIKRRMFRYRAANAVSVAPGEALNLEGAKVGEVVTSAACGAATELLAVVGLEVAGKALDSERGTRFEPLALPYAVA